MAVALQFARGKHVLPAKSAANPFLIHCGNTTDAD